MVSIDDVAPLLAMNEQNANALLMFLFPKYEDEEISMKDILEGNFKKVRKNDC
ncbi:hypothetical protein ACT9XH_04560 [Methanococcoides methylutens]|uniref:hypothetical protein n=1 Tax=Methanococcoides methylutens TaxID=2226 RepID=UPI0040446F62